MFGHNVQRLICFVLMTALLMTAAPGSEGLGPHRISTGDQHTTMAPACGGGHVDMAFTEVGKFKLPRLASPPCPFSHASSAKIPMTRQRYSVICWRQVFDDNCFSSSLLSRHCQLTV